MPNYCTLSIEKIKSFESMNSRFEHNHRLREVMNADPTLLMDNEIYINEEEINYQDLYKRAVDTDYYKSGKRIRKDAVKGFEIVTSFTHGAEETLDMDQWVKDNIDFISKQFGGRQNIKDAVLHRDESTPHLHVFVVPMTEDGRLCAKKYIDGRKDMIRLQDEYGKAMAAHGLSRGEKGSFMKHNDIRQFYSELGNAIGSELPEPKEKENIRTYYERINTFYKKAMVQKLKEKQNYEREMNEKMARRIAPYKGLENFVKEAKDKFGTMKKAKEKLFEEKYYMDLGLETMQTEDPEQYQACKQMIDILEKAGKIREKGMKDQVLDEQEIK